MADDKPTTDDLRIAHIQSAEHARKMATGASEVGNGPRRDAWLKHERSALDRLLYLDKTIVEACGDPDGEPLRVRNLREERDLAEQRAEAAEAERDKRQVALEKIEALAESSDLIEKRMALIESLAHGFVYPGDQ